MPAAEAEPPPRDRAYFENENTDRPRAARPRVVRCKGYPPQGTRWMRLPQKTQILNLKSRSSLRGRQPRPDPRHENLLISKTSLLIDPVLHGPGYCVARATPDRS